MSDLIEQPNSANRLPFTNPNQYTHPAPDPKWDPISAKRADENGKPELAECVVYHNLEGGPETSEELNIIGTPYGYQQKIARIKVPEYEVEGPDGHYDHTVFAEFEVYQAVGAFAPNLLNAPRSLPPGAYYETAMPGEVSVIGAQDARDLSMYNELTEENRRNRMEDAPPEVTVIQPGQKQSFGRSRNLAGSSVIGYNARYASKHHFDIEVLPVGVRITDVSENGTQVYYRPDIEQLPEMRQNISKALDDRGYQFYADNTVRGPVVGR